MKFTEVLNEFLADYNSETLEIGALSSATSLDADGKVKMWKDLFSKAGHHGIAKMEDLKESIRELLEVSHIFYDTEAFLAHLESHVQSDMVTEETFLEALSSYSNNFFWGLWWRGPGHGWWK